MGQFLDIEETFIASAAHDMRHGLQAPLTTYVHTEYSTGTLGLALLAWLVTGVAGETLIAVKLISVAFSLATVWLVILLGSRLFDRTTGLVAGLLMALGPIGWIARGVQTLGDTSEVLPFILLQWWLVGSAAEQRGWRAGVHATALGLVSGLGLAFSLGFAPSLLLFGLWCVCYWRPPVRLYLLAALGLAVGLAVPLYNLAQHGHLFVQWRGMGPAQMLAGPGEAAGALRQIFGLEAMQDHNMGLEIEHPGLALTAYRLYWGALLGALPITALLCALRRWRGDKDGADARWLPLLLAAAYLGAYLLNQHRKPYLLLMVVPPAVLLLAHCAVALRSRPYAAIGLVALLCACELTPWTVLPLRQNAAPVYEVSLADRVRWTERLGTVRAGWYGLPDAHIEGRQVALPLDEAFGCGYWLAQKPHPAPLLAHLAAMQDARAADMLAEGYGYGLAWEHDATLLLQTLALIPEDRLRQAAWRGAGRCLGERFWMLERIIRLPRRAHPRDARAYYYGYGFGLGFRFWHNSPHFHTYLEQVPPRWRNRCLEGLRHRLTRDLPAGPRRKALLDAHRMFVFERDRPFNK